MGCWYGTCGITNTPIHDGDDTKLVFLRAKSLISGSGTCYPDDAYEPIAFVVSGKYDAYGSITHDDNDELNHLVYGMIRHQLSSSIFDSCNIQDLQSLIETVCVGGINDISFMLVHSSVWDDVIIEAGRYIPSYNFIQDGEDKSYRSQFIYGYEAYIASYPIAAKHGIYLPQTDTHTYFINSVASKIMWCINDENDFKSEIVKNAAVELCLINNALNRSRKFWSPQSGAGSQDSDYEILKVISKHVELLERRYMNDVN